MPAETPVTFSTLLVSLASTALAHLGQAEGVDVPVDKRLAHHTLEVLDLLAVKTAGTWMTMRRGCCRHCKPSCGAPLAR